MALRSPVDRFRSAAESTTPARMLVLLYERLHRDVTDAEAAFAAGERHGAHVALLHAQEIVTELDAALDAATWSDAPRMSELYQFLIARLIDANVRQDASALRDCRLVIEPLLETWRAAWQEDAAGAVPATVSDDGQARRIPLDVAG